MARALLGAETSEPDALPATASRRTPLLLLGLSLVALLVTWQIATVLAADPRLMPGPVAVTRALWRELVAGELLFHLGITLLRVVASFVIAMTLGSAIGYVMGRSRLTDDLLSAWLVFFLNLPALVVIILAYIWIGLDETAAI